MHLQVLNILVNIVPVNVVEVAVDIELVLKFVALNNLCRHQIRGNQVEQQARIRLFVLHSQQ